jgi:phenylacetate-CoA ligase
MLFGYPSALAHIARHAERSGQLVNDLGVRVAFVTSERLYEDQRADIGRIFGCQVANGYGGRDAGFIAHECAEGGMHITAEDVVVEVIGGDEKPLPPGQAGEVVITHLATRDYPFIRYRTGDVAVLSQDTCSCGRGLPLLTEVQGRTTDFVVAHDGTVMHGLALIYVIREVEGVEQFKIIQEDRVHTRILLVTNDRFTPESHQRVKRGVEDRLGAGVRIDIQEVNEIPREASGKYRYVVSKVELEGHP